ncbi:uncharacterized protein LOC121878791 [Homarus americanus]|uniref:uncharacterized protein LOC121878791 n=1 Tax=Homarus americanus TaxID=6706 RepID=UPI001C438B18|nr:uncharacterized protein LOC121878791 [Homarus americanus]
MFMMASQQCLCVPLLCAKCPSEYKSLYYLRQHLASKYRASRRQTSLVSQKNRELQMNCKQCLHDDHDTVPWFPSICFPTEKILQDHMEVTHKILNNGKHDHSGPGSVANVCVCLKVFQCHICPQSYYESSGLEKHWQVVGHQPKNRETVLSDLQERAKISKASCKKCSRESHTKVNNDVCSCRKTFICSVCLATFSCYPSLKKHWKMTNHHSAQDYEDELTGMRGIDCPACSPQIVRETSYIKEGSNNSVCFNKEDALNTGIFKGDAHDVTQFIDNNTKPCDVKASDQYCSKTLLNDEQMSRCVNQMVAIDTDDTDNDEDVDFDSKSSSNVQPPPVSGEVKCKCPLLKCPTCPVSYFKCRDLYQHMRDVDHMKEHYFEAIRKKKKYGQLLCSKHTGRKIIKGKKLVSTCHNSIVCNTVDAIESKKTKTKNNLLKATTTKDFLNSTRNEIKKSCVSNNQKKYPCIIESPSSTNINCSEDTSGVTVNSCDDEATMHLDSPMVEMKYIKDDFESDDTLVTITISEVNEGGGESNMKVDCSPPVHITGGSASGCPIDLQSCFEQCLKFISADCTCGMKRSLSSSQVSVTGLNEATGCPACCSEVTCLLCSHTFSSYFNLKDHFLKDHSLSDSAHEVSNPSSEFIAIVSQQLKILNCSCNDYECDHCKTTFKKLLNLLHHVLIDHPDFYSSFPFFAAQRKGNRAVSCPRCAILDKLCVVNYYLFIRVLMVIESCSEEACAPLLQWCPAGESLRSTKEYESKLINEESHQGGQYLDDDTEVVCYSIQQESRSGKGLRGVKKTKYAKASKCICPLLKCPECPKTTANFGDLRKHARINDHNVWNKMKLLWKKYKIIKEHCTACSGYSYLSYIFCPHCPHMSFEDEDAAQGHMDSLHGGGTNRSALKTDLACTCTKQFLCMKCDTYYRTPQGLHHHMRRLGHETRENFDAIPRMIRKKMEDKKKCPRCSLFMSSKARVTTDEDQENCSCKWAVCSTCGNSYKKISVLLDHMTKMEHPIDEEYIESEKKKLITSFKNCQKCSSMEDRYCIFCNTRQNFIYHHMRTHHQDQLIFLSSGENCELFDEYDLNSGDLSNKIRDIAKYECSICFKSFLHTTTLRRHVSKIHPDCYYTLQCKDLSTDKLKMEDFASQREIKVLATVSVSEKG